MIRVNTIAEVTYFCEIDGEDEQKILNYMKENDCSLDEAVGSLMYQIELYKDSYTTDFNTMEVFGAEQVDDDD